MKTPCGLLLLSLGLCCAGSARAQAGVTPLLVKTDMACNWKMDGQPMSPLQAGGSTVTLLYPGEHRIEAVTLDGIATFRTRVEVGTAESTASISFINEHQEGVQRAQTEEPGSPAEAGGAPAATMPRSALLAPTWTDAATGLTWTRKDNAAEVDWPEASRYCADLRLAGSNGWRLPTYPELQAIYDSSVTELKRFPTGVTYHLHVKGKLVLTGWYWSTSQDAHEKESGEYQIFSFHDKGGQGAFPLHFKFSMRALCVHGSAENGSRQDGSARQASTRP